MTRARYSPRPTVAVWGTPFESAEEAWLWAARAARHAADGGQTTANQATHQRPCEPRDMIALVCRLRRERRLTGPQLGALCRFGALDRPPDPRDPEESAEARDWDTGLDRLVKPLTEKGILRPPAPRYGEHR